MLLWYLWYFAIDRIIGLWKDYQVISEGEMDLYFSIRSFN